MKAQKLYIMQRDKYIKIGIGVDPERRVKELQTGSPIPIYLLGYMNGGRELETKLHDRFWYCHIRNENAGEEWFTPHPSLLWWMLTKRVYIKPTLPMLGSIIKEFTLSTLLGDRYHT